MSRIDKYVWAVRLTKTRSLATKMCKEGKIKLDDKEVKPSVEVKIGQVISVKKHNAIFSYEIIDLLDKRVGAKLVPDYLLDITPEEELEKFKTYQMAQAEYRRNGMGRPTTKERRALNKYLKKGM